MPKSRENSLGCSIQQNHPKGLNRIAERPRVAIKLCVSEQSPEILSEIDLPHFLKNLSPGFFCAFSLSLLVPFSVKMSPPPILYFLCLPAQNWSLVFITWDISNRLSFYPHRPGLVFPCRLASSSPVYSKATLLLLHCTWIFTWPET